jgi:hypothetical protein
VSGAIATVFYGHGQAYQAISAQLATFHDQFMETLTGSGSSYAGAEAANARTTGAANPAPGLPREISGDVKALDREVNSEEKWVDGEVESDLSKFDAALGASYPVAALDAESFLILLGSTVASNG